MTNRKPGPKIYWRKQGGSKRAYADLRSFADVGGKQEALIAPGERRAATDPAVAHMLLAERVKELDGCRRGRVLHGVEKSSALAEFARQHLIAKKKSGQIGDQWIAAAEVHLRRAVDFFGAARDLASISVAAVREWTTQLRTTPNGRGGVMSDGNVRHHLNTLSNLYRRAQAEGYVLRGYNPVAALMEKPSGKRGEAKWLEVHEAALVLETAAIVKPVREDLASPFAHPLIATFLLTGGRFAEVVGLEVKDISFDRKTVTFRPNRWRRLKTATSWRSIPLWPQVEQVLREYVFNPERPPSNLLFPSLATGKEAMVTDCRKLLDRVAVQAGWQRGQIRSKMFRHSYCAARLQTLDEGKPVSTYTVARELGHGGDTLVRRVYGHLGQVRHRADVVEYRLDVLANRESTSRREYERQ